MKVMLKKVLNMVKIAVEVVLVIGFIFFEQIIWEWMVKPIRDYMVGLKIFQRLQAKIEAQDTYQTLVIFLVPLGIAEAMGVYSGALILHGALTWGVILYILKVPVAGLTFWMFGFSKEKLLTIDWFATLYGLLIKGFDWIKATGIYKSVVIKTAEFKAYVKSLIPTESVIKAEFIKIYTKIKAVFVEHDIQEEEVAMATATGQNGPQSVDEAVRGDLRGLKKDELNIQVAKSKKKSSIPKQTEKQKKKIKKIKEEK